MDLLVGCPVSHRQWVLDPWFDHVEKAARVAGREPTYIFVGDPSRDPSFAVIGQCAPQATILAVEDLRSADRRCWQQSRYHRMVELRNVLLDGVRHRSPSVFLSLDSDILLHPEALALMIADLERFDAVGARCYMTSHGTRAPSYGNLGREGSLQRIDTFGTIGCQVIMAAKLMSPPAYRVDYRFDLQGEDIGWSRACAEAGLRLGWEGRVISKHVLDPQMLARVDPRVGF